MNGETFTVQSGRRHFYLCGSEHGKIAKSIGDSVDAQELIHSIARALNTWGDMLTALKFVRRNCPIGDIDPEALHTIIVKGSTIQGVILAIMKAEGRA